jgi:hypothetical protein
MQKGDGAAAHTSLGMILKQRWAQALTEMARRVDGHVERQNPTSAAAPGGGGGVD